MNCILFSIFYTQTEENRKLVKYYIDVIRNKFKDFDVYVGISGKVDEWLRIQLPQKWSYGVVSDNLKVNSDVDGYRKALYLLKEANKRYYTVWFFHTKGASYSKFEDSKWYRDLLEQDYFNNRDFILSSFDDELNLGIIGHEPSYFGVQEHMNTSLCIKRKFGLSHYPIGFFYCGTFYVMSGLAVDYIIHLLSDKFYDVNISNVCNGDKYFFEGVFKSFPEMFGLYPKIIREEEYKQGEYIQRRAIELIENWRKFYGV